MGCSPTPLALTCADHAQSIVAAGANPQPPPERATERIAVLMTPTEKAAYADRANSLGLSLGQFSLRRERLTPTATLMPKRVPSRKRKPWKRLSGSWNSAPAAPNKSWMRHWPR
jgi:hypothetical protein